MPPHQPRERMDYDEVRSAGRRHTGEIMYSEPPLRNPEQPYTGYVKFECRPPADEVDFRQSSYGIEVHDGALPSACTLVVERVMQEGGHNDYIPVDGHPLLLDTTDAACRVARVISAIDYIQTRYVEAVRRVLTPSGRLASHVRLPVPRLRVIAEWLMCFGDAHDGWPPGRLSFKPAGYALGVVPTVRRNGLSQEDVNTYFPLSSPPAHDSASEIVAWFITRAKVSLVRAQGHVWITVIDRQEAHGFIRFPPPDSALVTLLRALLQLALEHTAEALSVASELRLRSDNEIQAVRDQLDVLLRRPIATVDAHRAFNELEDILDPSARPRVRAPLSPWEHCAIALIALVCWCGDVDQRGASEGNGRKGPVNPGIRRRDTGSDRRLRPREQLKLRLRDILRDGEFSARYSGSGLARRLGRHQQSNEVRNALQELEDEGYVRLDPATRRWMPTPKAFEEPDDNGPSYSQLSVREQLKLRLRAFFRERDSPQRRNWHKKGAVIAALGVSTRGWALGKALEELEAEGYVEHSRQGWRATARLFEEPEHDHGEGHTEET